MASSTHLDLGPCAGRQLRPDQAVQHVEPVGRTLSAHGRAAGIVIVNREPSLQAMTAQEAPEQATMCITCTATTTVVTTMRPCARHTTQSSCCPDIQLQRGARKSSRAHQHKTAQKPFRVGIAHLTQRTAAHLPQHNNINTGLLHMGQTVSTWVKLFLTPHSLAQVAIVCCSLHHHPWPQWRQLAHRLLLSYEMS